MRGVGKGKAAIVFMVAVALCLFYILCVTNRTYYFKPLFYRVAPVK